MDNQNYGTSQAGAMDQNYLPSDVFAVDAPEELRSSFIAKTYLHLAGAIAAFIAIEAVVLNTMDVEPLMQTMLGTQYSWLIVLGVFMGVSWIADIWANNSTSKAMQYAGLGLYVVAESIIFLPILFIAQNFYPGVIVMAGGSTVALTAILTAIVFITRKDFSFLRTFLIFGGLAAMGLIALAIVVGFDLGPIFTYAMIALACGYILYDTSNIMLNYRTDQYVAASLALFASVALLFWYILQLWMSAQRD